MSHHPASSNFDPDYHKFRLTLLSLDEIPLKIACIFGICSSKEEIKLVFDRLKKEKLCSDKLLLKIVGISKECGIDLTYEVPTLFEKLGFKNEKV